MAKRKFSYRSVRPRRIAFREKLNSNVDGICKINYSSVGPRYLEDIYSRFIIVSFSKQSLDSDFSAPLLVLHSLFIPKVNTVRCTDINVQQGSITARFFF